MTETTPQPPTTGHCPICDANDAFVEQLGVSGDFYVECVNCKVYRASRRAFRHFEYLRWRGDPAGLAKLEHLARILRGSSRGGALRLEYDTWEALLHAREPSARRPH